MSTPISWQEVEECLERVDPEFLSFLSDEVLARYEKLNDLFGPVQTLKQKLPQLPGVEAKPKKKGKPRDWTKA